VEGFTTGLVTVNEQILEIPILLYTTKSVVEMCWQLQLFCKKNTGKDITRIFLIKLDTFCSVVPKH